MGGYLYFNCAPDADSFDAECRRLLEDIHKFDVLRSDRSIGGNGLAPRTPYLDINFVREYLSIPS
jgi:asparagine synthase (glutamine-hydrolysing)